MTPSLGQFWITDMDCESSGSPRADTKSDWTFFLLKPDAVERQLTSAIRTRIENAGFLVTGWTEIDFEPQDVDALFHMNVMRSADDKLWAAIHDYLTQYLCSGACIHVKVRQRQSAEHGNLFTSAIEVRGATFLPEQCEEGSIRFDFREERSDVPRPVIGSIGAGIPVVDGIVRNLIHTPMDSDERDLQMQVISNIIRSRPK